MRIRSLGASKGVIFPELWTFGNDLPIQTDDHNETLYGRSGRSEIKDNGLEMALLGGLCSKPPSNDFIVRAHGKFVSTYYLSFSGKMHKTCHGEGAGWRLGHTE